MNPGPVFLKLRTLAFSCIIAINFVWVVLSFVELFLRWDQSQPTQRNLVLIIAVMNALTTIILILLIILKFRPWLDAARLFLLIIAHTGPAVGFTVYVSKQPCPQDGTNEEGICETLNIYIALASWVVPTCLLVYSIMLGTVCYRHRHDPPEENMSEKRMTGTDEESAITPRQSALPMMPPPASPFPFRDRRSFSSHRASTRPSFSAPSTRTSTSTTPQMPPLSRPMSQSQRHMSLVPKASMPAVRKVPPPITPAERHRSRTLSIPPLPGTPVTPLSASPPRSPGGQRLSKPVQPQWTWDAI